MENLGLTSELDYAKMQRIINKITSKYQFAKKISLGKSLLGRDITAIKLGTAEDYALYTAAFHGSEHITTNVLLMFLEELCHATQNETVISKLKARSIYERGVIIVPRVNPDGCEIAIHGKYAAANRKKEIEKYCGGDYIHYNANARGVDINHNFDAGFYELKEKEKSMGITGPNKTRFGGYEPESEPETKALVKLTKEKNIRTALCLHSQGRVIYWSYGDKMPKHSLKMAQILKSVSSYSLETATGIAEGGGFKDYFIKEYKRPAFTLEIGKGENPLPITEAPDLYGEIKELLSVFAIM